MLFATHSNVCVYTAWGHSVHSTCHSDVHIRHPWPVNTLSTWHSLSVTSSISWQPKCHGNKRHWRHYVLGKVTKRSDKSTVRSPVPASVHMTAYSYIALLPKVRSYLQCHGNWMPRLYIDNATITVDSHAILWSASILTFLEHNTVVG